MKEKGKHIREEIRVQPEQRKKRKIKRPVLYWKPGGGSRSFDFLLMAKE
jgi:hypothetical protein